MGYFGDNLPFIDHYSPEWYNFLMGKIIAIIGLFMLILFLSYENYQLFSERGEAQRNYAELKSKYDAVTDENVKIQNDIQYYSNAANLLKEARSQLNYHLPDEKEIIVVPKK